MLARCGSDGAEAELQAQALLQLPHVRSVAVMDGETRLRHVAGDPSLEITYREDGLHFQLDLARRVSRLGKSQGSFNERQRIRNLVRAGERVLVLGAGFGLTPCIIGAHTRCSEVVGVERNAAAHEFALANIRRNRLEGKTRSVHADPFGDLTHLGVFHRVCAFLPFFRERELMPLSEVVASSVAVVAPGGTLHCYAFEKEQELAQGGEEATRQLRLACPGRPVELTWRGKVPRKSIGPFVYRVGMDFLLG